MRTRSSTNPRPPSTKDETESLLPSEPDQDFSDNEQHPQSQSTNAPERRHSHTQPSDPQYTAGAPKSTGWLNINNDMSGSERIGFVKEMTREILPVMVFSMIGALVAGSLLEKQQNWPVFKRIPELWILVPILLNLKGNLEMNLAARFSTSANMGELDFRMTRQALVAGNMALLQVQALIVSFVSGVLAIGLGVLSRRSDSPIPSTEQAFPSPLFMLLKRQEEEVGHSESLGGYIEVLSVLSVGMLAASLSAAVMGSFMCALVILCRKFKINPDNVATPLASALGDIVTLVILGALSAGFILFMSTLTSTLTFACLLAAIGINFFITSNNAYVLELLTIGWTPLFVAMVISSGAGVVLETYVYKYDGFALFAAVLMSVTANAGAIFVSRISTAMHANSKEPYATVSVALFSITLPILACLLLFAWIVGHMTINFWFIIWFLIGSSIQTLLALFLGFGLSNLLWRLDYDPDIYAIPVLTSILDVVAQLILAVVFAWSAPALPDLIESIPAF